MKIAILSDVHANLEAFEVVLDKCRSIGVTHYLFLGDIVGYNADPQKCLSLLRNLENVIGIVKGNHDEYASNGDKFIEGFNPHAKMAVLWTQEQLSTEEMQFLQSLPYTEQVRGQHLTIVHATLDSPRDWGYIFDEYQAADNFSYQKTSLCFCGHSHYPVAFYRDPQTYSVVQIKTWTLKDDEDVNSLKTNESDEIEIPIVQHCKYLINVGSVGQPRNRDPRASFAVYDQEKKIMTRYRLSYDFRTTQKKIREVGLPEVLALRLERGS